ncbi:MAG: carboxyl-terminal processing protease [Parcubacteria group bacterium Greene0714_7]|nr:MAG: carboxyl-terminal processing protease [Parcubacteria group bacterium Greene0714_7]
MSFNTPQLHTVRLFILRHQLVLILVATVIALSSGGAYVWAQVKSAESAIHYQTPEEADVYVRFDMEVYDSITSNYWMKPEDLKLPELFRLSVEKVTATTTVLVTPDRAGTAKMLEGAFRLATSTENKRQIALNIGAVVLYNLPPAGRDGILSKKEEVALRENVSNIDSSKDLYQNLGLEKGATSAEVTAAYKKKAAIFANATSTEDKAALAVATYAQSVLTNNNSKALYDSAGIEPTVFPHTLGSTLYLHINKISPTTLREFGLAVDAASTTPGLSSMVLDLRGNIGGSLDFLPAFFGLFVGANQYTFDLFHQGEYQVERTTQEKFPLVSRYSEIAILTDAMTQSTAELTAATFKKFNRAHVVGGTTRGWGTVENTYPLKTVIDPTTSYSLLLVNSITLREDNQPVEGRGVDPDVDTSKSGWENKLSNYFDSTSLINAIRKTATKPPLK